MLAIGGNDSGAEAGDESGGLYFGSDAGSPGGERNDAGTGGWAGDATAPSGLRNAANRLLPGR